MYPLLTTLTIQEQINHAERRLAENMDKFAELEVDLMLCTDPKEGEEIAAKMERIERSNKALNCLIREDLEPAL